MLGHARSYWYLSKDPTIKSNYAQVLGHLKQKRKQTKNRSCFASAINFWTQNKYLMLFKPRCWKKFVNVRTQILNTIYSKVMRQVNQCQDSNIKCNLYLGAHQCQDPM